MLSTVDASKSTTVTNHQWKAIPTFFIPKSFLFSKCEFEFQSSTGKEIVDHKTWWQCSRSDSFFLWCSLEKNWWLTQWRHHHFTLVLALVGVWLRRVPHKTSSNNPQSGAFNAQTCASYCCFAPVWCWICCFEERVLLNHTHTNVHEQGSLR